MTSPRSLLCAAALCVAGLSSPGAAVAACHGAHQRPTSASLGRDARATFCLVNRARARHGLAPVRRVAALRRAAVAYSSAMVVGGFFSHTGPDGSTPAGRVRKTGYLRGARGWSIGETLAWGTGPFSTPASIVRSWMHSPGHRAILLDGRFRDVGIGVAIGAPGVRGQGATVTADFGTRG